MNKLFSDEKDELEIGTIVRTSNTEQDVDIEGLKEAEDSASLVTENFSLVADRLSEANQFATTYLSKPVASIEYFASLEAHTSMLNNIANNLGTKVHVPSLEDFTNTYSTKAAHDVALEGLGDIIKNLWIKLKDLLSRFFKKINEFFRRVTNANLEIDSYEKYIPDLIKKIKTDKLTIKDGDIKLKSKLPVMLANPGMNEMDSVFLINHGLQRMTNLAAVIDTRIIPGLRQIASTRLKELKSTLERITTLEIKENTLEENLNEFKSATHKAIIDIIKEICPVPVSASDLPDQAFDELSESLYHSKLSDLMIYSLLDSRDTFARLPKNFNLYLALGIETSKTFAVASNEEEHVSMEMTPASDLEALIRLNEFYSKYKKQIDTKKLNAVLKDNESATEDFNNFMIKSFDSAKKAIKFSSGGGDVDPGLLVNLLINHAKKLADSGSVPWQRMADIDTITLGLLDDIEYVKPEEIHTRIMFLSIDKRNQIATVLKEECGEIIPGVGESISVQSEAFVRKTIDDIEKFIMSLLQSLQVVYRSLTATTVSISTELRYELAKYIYDSARLFD